MQMIQGFVMENSMILNETIFITGFNSWVQFSANNILKYFYYSKLDLTLSILDKIFIKQHFGIFFSNSLFKIGQHLACWVKISADFILIFFSYFSKKINPIF